MKNNIKQGVTYNLEKKSEKDRKKDLEFML